MLPTEVSAVFFYTVVTLVFSNTAVRRLFACFSACCLLASGGTSARPLEVALMYSYGPEITSSWYADTLRTIREAAAPETIRVTTYDPDGFLKAADKKAFDIAIASSGLTSLMISRTDGIPLLTVTTHRTPDANFGNGAAIVTRSNRNDIRTLADLKGKTVAVMSKTAFAGWQIPLVEMIHQGIDPRGFFKNVIVTGAPMTNIIDAVITGNADAGFLVTCLTESLIDKGQLDPKALKFINEKTDGTIACRRSSDLYPNWLLTVKPTVSADVARRITKGLLALPEGKDGLTWTIPTDHRRIYELFNTLQMPLKNEASLGWFLQAYWPWIAGAISLLFLLLGNVVMLALIVRRKTAQTEIAVKEKLASNIVAKESAMKLEALNRASAVGLLSGMVAHELKQPLTVISNYAGSLKQRLARGDAVSRDTLLFALEEIIRSNMTASDIVNHIRRYAKTQPLERYAEPLSDIARRAVTRYRQTAKPRTVFTLDLTTPSPKVDMDPTEVELVVTNLVKNASQAASAQTDEARVDVAVTADSDYAILTVKDNGPEISDEALNAIGNVGLTTKTNGLGLGVAIIRSLLEVHGASLTYRKHQPEGLTAVVKWPLSRD